MLISAITIFLICVLVGSLTAVHGLKCMSCFGSGLDNCDSRGRMLTCMPNQKLCETVVRRDGVHMTVMKGCKNDRACRDNQMQNTRYAGRLTQCNLDQPNSVCTCCCGKNYCNVGFSTCTGHFASSAPVNDCPEVPDNFPHGNIECNNENKAGSVCEYQCTGQDYFVWPKGQEVNVCLRNGSWARELPCCARPCPPYYLLDDVLLFHLKGENQQNRLDTLLRRFGDLKFAEDALKMAALYYATKPIETSVVRFNEYGADFNRFLELALQRISVVPGPANTGAAIQYALDNLLAPEAGVRDSRVPKAIWVFIANANPADDVKTPSEEARRLGYQLFVVGSETNGFKFDRKKLFEITGNEEHLFLFDNDVSNLSTENVAVINNYFCGNPCDHVLHDHE